MTEFGIVQERAPPRETVTGDIDGMGGLDAWGRMWRGAMDAWQAWAAPRVAA